MKPITPTISTEDARLTSVVFAKDQPEYLQLPAIKSACGRVTTRWRLDWRERLRVIFSGDLWLQVLTFGEPLQPVRILTKEPTTDECAE